MSQKSFLPRDSPCQTSVLEELMELRTQARLGKSFRELLDASHFKEMIAYPCGYLCCAGHNGLGDVEADTFFGWLELVKKEYEGGWMERIVEVCGGSHEAAMMRWLDFVDEYLGLRQHQPLDSFPKGPGSNAPPLRAPPERYVSVLEELRYIRLRDQQGYPFWLALCGGETLPALVSFIRGYVRCCERNGFLDRHWQSFACWMARFKGLSQDSLAPRLLEICGGDHEAAMRRLLDWVDEYTREHPLA